MAAGHAGSSPTERAVAPSETTGLQVLAVGRRLQKGLAADGQPDAADATRLDVRAAREERDRGVEVALALVQPYGFGSPSLSPSPRRSNSSTP